MALRSNAARLIAVLRDAPAIPGTRLCETCGKKRFATREAAERIIARRQAAGYPETRTYVEHGWWHLTSQD